MSFVRFIDTLIKWPLVALITMQLAVILACDEKTLPIFLPALVILFWVILFCVRHKWRQIFIILLVLAANLLVIKTGQHPVDAAVLNIKQTFLATVIKKEAIATRTQLIVDLKKIVSQENKITGGRIMITVPQFCKIPVAATIRFTAKISQARSFHNPGVFDYATYLQHQDIWAKGFLPRCQDITVLDQGSPMLFATINERIKHEVENLDLKHGDIVLRLTLGTQSIDPEKNLVIQKTGLSHLFTISGLHFGMMATMLFFFLNVVLKRLSFLWKKIPRQKVVTALTLVFVICYTLTTDGHPAIRRSAIMMTLYLLTTLLEKQKNLLYIFLLSFSADLFIYPFDLFLLSFQLSYLCVATLIVVYPKIETVLKKICGNFIPKQITDIVAVSILLTFLLGPLIVASFGGFSFNGILHNLWAIPLFEFFIMPIGLVYLLLALMNLPGTATVLRIWDHANHWFLMLLDWMAQWQWDNIIFPQPHNTHLILFYAALFAGFSFQRKIFGIILGGLLLVSLACTYNQNFFGFDLRITQIDVGQGDAILIEIPQKKILIDGGGHRYTDIGEMALRPYLLHKWIRKLDLVVITHSDIDHFGGITALKNGIKTGAVWINDEPAKAPVYADILADMSSRGVTVSSQVQRKKIRLDDKTTLEILSPTKKIKLSKNNNDHSLVIKLQHGNFCALFTGDISSHMEEKLVKTYGQELDCNLLKVSHHGSRYSSSEKFLKIVSPQIAVIGVAKNSQFGHPHPDTLRRLANIGGKTYRTDLDGAVQITIQNEKVSVDKFLRE